MYPEVSNIEVKKEKGWKVFIGFDDEVVGALKSTIKEVWWGQSQISEVGKWEREDYKYSQLLLES